MFLKSKLSLQKKSPPRNSARHGKPKEIYPSLATGPKPAERLARLLAEARKQGVRPLTAEQFDRLMEGPSDWPEEDCLDEFLDWLHQLRREK